MCSVYHHFDASGMCRIGDLSHRIDVPCPVDDVVDLHHLRLAGELVGIALDDSGIIFHGRSRIDPFEYDLIPLLPLLPGVDHVGIILFGQYHFIAGFQVETEDDVIQSLGRIPC